ncbi:hypothetical protein Ocepr_2384 (plasmid) [Oceanithermus profundus DSM 14977]|uniref:Uncharacterized protein n=1 Tax=Oceanithermus profundus (strain DSM 14977 / NBRC 100410 / VKM B-2274 / 506) TaxID=670487 RepID=E4UAQ3_OCEP5|nr:hypothetical protein [Oceanithermus profundus]ADR37832.1 hypothetical protein Ocepr_2384 [Oceanithermus profundus DSM 14977]
MKNRIGRFGRGGRASRRHEDKAAEIRRRIEIFAAATGVAVETLEDLVWEVLDWFRVHDAKVRLEGTRAIYTGNVKDQPWKAVFDVVGAYGLSPQGVKKVLEEHLRGERDQLPRGMRLYPVTAYPMER